MQSNVYSYIVVNYIPNINLIYLIHNRLSYLKNTGLINFWYRQYIPDNFIPPNDEQWEPFELNKFREMFSLYGLGGLLAIIAVIFEILIDSFYKTIIFILLKNYYKYYT